RVANRLCGPSLWLRPTAVRPRCVRSRGRLLAHSVGQLGVGVRLEMAVPAMLRRDRIVGSISSPGGAGMPGCRAGPHPRNYAQALAVHEDRAPGGRGAWRIPTRDPAPAGPEPAAAGAARRLAALPPDVAPQAAAAWAGGPAGRSAAFSPARAPPPD